METLKSKKLQSERIACRKSLRWRHDWVWGRSEPGAPGVAN